MADYRISALSSLNFYRDWKHPAQMDECYRLRYLTTDPIRVQYADNGLNPTLRLVNAGTDEIRIIIPTLIATTEDGYNVYNVDLQYLKAGCYLFQFVINNNVIDQSEFSIHVQLPETKLIKYTNLEDAINTVFVEGQYFCFRIDADFFPQDVDNASEAETFRDQRYGLTQLSASPYNLYTLSFGGTWGAPNFVGDKMNRILACSEVLIDSVQWVKADGEGVTKEVNNVAYPKYQFKIQLERANDGEKVATLADTLLPVVAKNNEDEVTPVRTIEKYKIVA